MKTTRFDFDLDLKPYYAYTSISEGDNCFELKPVKQPGFYEVVNPLYVFKKIRSEAGYNAIASLIVPKGALIFIGTSEECNPRSRVSIGHSGKMRASEAYVHSITRIVDSYTDLHAGVRVYAEQKVFGAACIGTKELKHGKSMYSSSFKYHVGKTVKPGEFSKYPNECAGGIHFFLTAKEAISYI